MKYKVFNNNLFNVGIRFENEANREILIRGKSPTSNTPSFVSMDEDDILYIDTASTLFEEGILYVEDQELNEKMGYGEKNPNSISDDEIKKIFGLSAVKMKEALDKIDAQHAIDKIVSLAKTADLAPSKLKVIKETYNIDIFEDLDQTVV